MGREEAPQGKLFYTSINLENRVRANHPLRKIDEVLDLSFVSNEVKDSYGYNGNVSIPPAIIVKLMLLLVFYNVRSERELMDTVPERLDWLWFLGYDLDSEIPNHSVLSKARRKWGVEVFQKLFERVVWQSVESGLVDGTKIFMDSSLVEADASNNSVVDQQSLKRHLNQSYRRLEERLEEVDGKDEDKGGKGIVNKRYISTTDPDASVVRHKGRTPKLSYKTHRVVDSSHEIITAVDTTGGSINEAHKMQDLSEQHMANTEKRGKTIVADSKYGTKENYLACYDQGVFVHIPDLKKIQDKGKRRSEIYEAEKFHYDKTSDTYICPEGQRLYRRSHHKERMSSDYGTRKGVCKECRSREECTKAKDGRTVHRDNRQEELDIMRDRARTSTAKHDIQTRKHLMERSFARAVRYGFKRARWRGLWRVKIQDYMIATIQNLNTLIRHGSKPKLAEVVRLRSSAGNWVHSIHQFVVDKFWKTFYQSINIIRIYGGSPRPLRGLAMTDGVLN